MSVMNVVELVSAMEEKFGVSAAQRQQHQQRQQQMLAAQQKSSLNSMLY